MRVGVLTGGGDCPGLNAVIRAVVRKGVRTHGFDFVGYRDGWKGPLEGLTMELGVQQCRGILPRGGTILGSSRTNPFKIDGGVEKIKDNLAKDGVDALVAIGGEDTLGVATKLADLGVNVVGGLLTIWLGWSLPQARQRITNRAEPLASDDPESAMVEAPGP